MSDTWAQLHDRHENTWNLGDWLVATMMDGDTYRGILTGIFPSFITINGYGFPTDDIKEISDERD